MTQCWSEKDCDLRLDCLTDSRLESGVKYVLVNGRHSVTVLVVSAVQHQRRSVE